ncbi:MAG: formylglycine-generating enzyme family protein [Acidobacteriota bacterium]
MRSGVSRADLLRGYLASGESGLDSMARVAGYQRLPELREEPAPEAEPLTTDTVAVTAPRKDTEARRVPFWQPTVVEEREVDGSAPDPYDGVQPLPPPSTSTERAPESEELECWSRLEPVLRSLLSTAASSRRPDIPRLVRRLSQRRAVEQVPRQRRRTWPTSLTVLIDHDRRLVPFWEDMARVWSRLREHCGGSAIKARVLLSGPRGPATDERGRVHRQWREAASEGPVLALSDLGHFGTWSEREDWLSEARRLREEGRSLAALVPCPPTRWQVSVTRAWNAAAWERRLGVPASTPWEERRLQARRLLTLLSPALRVEPGLLRAVRRSLPAAVADVGTELDAWRHELLRGRHAAAAAFRSLGLRETFATARHSEDEPVDPCIERFRERVVEQLEHWRRHLPDEIRVEETLTLWSLTPDLVGEERRQEAAAYLPRLVQSLRASQGEEAADLVRWFGRLVARLPKETVAIEPVKEALLDASALVSQLDPQFESPVPLDPARLERLGGMRGTTRGWTVFQDEDGLGFDPSETVSDLQPSRALGSVRAATPLALVTVGEQRAQSHVLSAEERQWVPAAPEASVELLTDRSRLVLRRLEKPAWASAVGRDRYGLWAEVKVGVVRSRMRWIPPGTFWMGSPAGEAGRFRWETRHRVTLTTGHWLGETPCTQELWRELTGANPSVFQHPRRPVENVSWDDCQDFLRKLNERIEGLGAGLPTEAQWEHACRAGIGTATWVGDLVIRGENHASELDDIAWYGGNSGVDFDLEAGADSSDWEDKQYEHSKAGSRMVGLKQANPWGLKDMLGNVGEWCADWYGIHEGGDEVDPVGPDRGPGPVIRGGSWDGAARFCRMAYRNWRTSSYRWGGLGFRLSWGQLSEPEDSESCDGSGTSLSS